MIETNYINASQGKRMANFIIDSLIIFGIWVLVFGFIGKLVTFIPENISVRYTYPILLFIYYFLLEGIFKTTPGKLITGTKIIQADGSPLKFTGALIRSVIRLVPFEIFSYGNNNPVGWHDFLSETRVVEYQNNTIIGKGLYSPKDKVLPAENNRP